MQTIVRSLLCRMRPWLKSSLFCRYELASGAKLNVTKSHNLLVGTWTSRVNLPDQLDWSAQRITVMGALLSKVVDDASWAAPLAHLDAALAAWRQRHLSYHGCALVANTLGLSLFWYLSSFLTMSPQVVQAINAKVFSFIWQERRERLARSSVTQLPFRLLPCLLGSPTSSYPARLEQSIGTWQRTLPGALALTGLRSGVICTCGDSSGLCATLIG